MKPDLRTARTRSLPSYQATTSTQQQCNQTEFIFSLGKEILRGGIGGKHNLRLESCSP